MLLATHGEEDILIKRITETVEVAAESGRSELTL